VKSSTAQLWGAENPPGSVLKTSDTTQLLDTANISRATAIDIAKRLLLFALYMQTLPADFNPTLLESQNVEAAIELIVEHVKIFILSQEDGVHSIEVIECLTLLATIHLNDGAIQKAWLILRRTLDICRLHGLQNSYSLSLRDSTCSDMALRRRLWLSTVCGDCYCSLMLGLEPGLGIAPFGPEDEETWVDPFSEEDANVQRQLTLVIGRIAQRNAVGQQQDRHTLQEIDSALNKIQDSLPSSWWKVPSFRQPRSLDSAKEPIRLVCQLWFLQARIFTHFPVAFGRPAKDSLESMERCMEASRITMQIYIGLQYAKEQLSRCKCADHTVFLAALVLLLARVHLRYHEMHSGGIGRNSDQALLEQVLESFEEAGNMCHREHVVRECGEILSTMMKFDVASSSSSFNSNASLARETPFAANFSNDFFLCKTKSDMGNIITSLIQPSLDSLNPAAHLIKQVLSAEISARNAVEEYQEA
jgi:hypothetical protein